MKLISVYVILILIGCSPVKNWRGVEYQKLKNYSEEKLDDDFC